MGMQDFEGNNRSIPTVSLVNGPHAADADHPDESVMADGAAHQTAGSLLHAGKPPSGNDTIVLSSHNLRQAYSVPPGSVRPMSDFLRHAKAVVIIVTGVTCQA
jgi:hypothetical protein